MTDSDRESRSIEIWTKVRERLRAEVPEVVYRKRLEPLTLAESRGTVVRLVSPPSDRDWVANTYGARMLAIWRKEDDNITELEIIARPHSRRTPGQDGQADQRRAAAAKEEQRWVTAINSARERDRGEKQLDLEPVRKQLGNVGVWSRTPYFGPADKATSLAAAPEQLGYPALWIPGYDGGHVFERCGIALAASSKLTIATGIVNIWRHDPAEAAQATNKLRADSGGRFLLGLGGSHKGLIGDDYDKISPLAKMRGYLDELDASGLPPEDRLLGAFGPKMLELSAKRTIGAHPYLVPPEHTAAAREVLGQGPLLMPELGVILESDPVEARAIAREFVALYLGSPNYANSMFRLGYTEEDFTAEGTDISDRLIDALVAWGDPATIAARVQVHLDAGADHVAIQSWGPKPEVDVWRELAPVLLG